MSPPCSAIKKPEMAGELRKNPSTHGWIVQKFGGTSVGKFPDKIAEDIVKYVNCLWFLEKAGAGELTMAGAGHMSRTIGWWLCARHGVQARRQQGPRVGE